MLVRSVAANNHTGVQQGDNAGGGANSGIIRMTQVAITGNAFGWNMNANGVGSGVFSYGDNNIDGNADHNNAPSAIPRK
jgi:hypothetical protein